MGPKLSSKPGEQCCGQGILIWILITKSDLSMARTTVLLLLAIGCFGFKDGKTDDNLANLEELPVQLGEGRRGRRAQKVDQIQTTGWFSMENGAQPADGNNEELGEEHATTETNAVMKEDNTHGLSRKAVFVKGFEMGKAECGQQSTMNTAEKPEEEETAQEFNYSPSSATQDPVINNQIPLNKKLDYNCVTKNQIKGVNECGTNSLGQPAGHCACTSCYKTHALLPVYHKLFTGICVPYTVQGTMKCTTPNQNKQRYTIDKLPTLFCSRAFRTKVEFYYTELKNAIVRNTWERLLNAKEPKGAGHDGKQMVGVAFCNVFKQALCKSGKCKTQKTLSCHKVCKLKQFHKLLVYQHTCVPCNDKYGHQACATAAMMA